MKKKGLFFLFLSLLLVSYFAWAKLTSSHGDQKVSYILSQKECFSGSGQTSWRYCIHKPANGKSNGDVAYLLHGRGLDENTWNDDTFYTAMVQAYWQEKQVVPPVIVTVSFGKVWLLTSKGQTPKSGLLEIFINEVLKEVENRTGAPKNRIVFGESMGGLNSLELGLKAPSLFKKVAASCPPVYRTSPFSTLSEVQDFLKRTGADPKIAYGIILLGKDFFANEAEWKGFSPLDLIEFADPKNSPEFYLSCGLYDKYGNFEGNSLLSSKALARGFKWTWRPVYGGHCATDIVSLADFLVK